MRSIDTACTACWVLVATAPLTGCMQPGDEASSVEPLSDVGEDAPAIVQLEASYIQSCLRYDDGSVRCWNEDGAEVDVPDREFTTISLERDLACGITVEREIACWSPQIEDAEGWLDDVIAKTPAGRGWVDVDTAWEMACATHETTIAPVCWAVDDRNMYGPDGVFEQSLPPSGYDKITTSGVSACARDLETEAWFGWGWIAADDASLEAGYPPEGEPFDVWELSSGVGCGIRDGDGVCTGPESAIKAAKRLGLEDVQDVDIGSEICVLSVDGRVSCTGDLDGLASPPYRFMSTFFDYVCGVTWDDRIECAGAMYPPDGAMTPPPWQESP